MKLRTILFLVTCLGLSNSYANEKVVYGDDDRVDVYEESNELFLKLARSTAGMIAHSSLSDNGENVSISGSTLSSRGICTSARFADQITSANCSGFLVGKDLLVTAGHCIRTQSDCDKYAWVFDFAKDSQDKVKFEVSKNAVYSCKEIVQRDLSRATKNDFALIRLKREVSDREPLTFRTEGRVKDATPLVVIGHPTGLPTKIAAGAWVRDNSNDVYIVSNLDTFGGNSGSAVFDSTTGLIEGILVRGETDYTYNSELGCRVPKECTNEGCRGEDVTRITQVTELMNL
ncbi:MAG: trypsin-like peptidase domain-containing protein [Halobacteriovoraceae bacterium]|jgi:V8-like Glu-specific endopeptidase|nr:trypsin-like peptidase domain-containing protein [Halobacteriovoraceae bacterium]MBT5094866.1 trypsin-like peptidase domain-containing protein [Halobacteriovoraceae bacterium]